MADLSLAILGVAFPVYQACFKVKGQIDRACLYGSEVNRYRRKFRILRMRIGAWGRKWGLENARSQQQRYLLYSTEGTRYLILELLGDLEARQSRDEKLISRFNLFSGRDGRHPNLPPQTPGSTASRIRVMEGATAVQQAYSDEAFLAAEEQRQSSLVLKARWARDVSKVCLLYGDMEETIGGLERVEGIREEEMQGQSKKHRSTHTASTILYQSLKMSTQLLSCFQMSLKLEKDRQSLVPFAKSRLVYLRDDTVKFSLILSSLSPLISPIEVISVVIETSRPLASSDHPDSEARLTQDLDELLESLMKPRPGLEPFQAGGFLSVGGEQNHVVYRVPLQRGPNLSWVTLSTLLHQQVNIPNHEERLRLAQKLAFSIIHLRGGGWLPESLSSDNICFLHPEIKGSTDIPNLSSYLPRYYKPPTNTSEIGNLSSAEFMLHIPQLHSARSRSRRLFDMVGFGIILLAIGIWKQPSTILAEFKKALPQKIYSPGTPTPAQRWMSAAVQKYWLEKLKVLCDVENELGDRYRDVVVTCLLGDFYERGYDPKNERLVEAFSTLVAEPLDSILSP